MWIQKKFKVLKEKNLEKNPEKKIQIKLYKKTEWNILKEKRK